MSRYFAYIASLLLMLLALALVITGHRDWIWLLVIAGEGRIGPWRAQMGEGCFVQAETTHLAAGRTGLTCLVAYDAASPSHDLLRPIAARHATRPAHSTIHRPLLLAARANAQSPATEARA